MDSNTLSSCGNGCSSEANCAILINYINVLQQRVEFLTDLILNNSEQRIDTLTNMIYGNSDVQVTSPYPSNTFDNIIINEIDLANITTIDGVETVIQVGALEELSNLDLCDNFSANNMDINNCDFLSNNVPSEPDEVQPSKTNIMNCDPYKLVVNAPFHLFNMEQLDNSLYYTHKFSNRYAIYYGAHPYTYSGSTHNAIPISENEYLSAITSYLKIVLPHFAFNSVMIHKYLDGDFHMPYHSDDEDCIVDGSQIVSISLGATRSMKFKNKLTNQEICETELKHGDTLIMDKSSQEIYSHCIPISEESQDTRISLTFRYILPCNTPVLELSTQDKDGKPNDDDSLAEELAELDTIPDFHDICSRPLPTASGHIPFSTSSPRKEATPCHILEPPKTSQLKSQNIVYISSSMFRFLDGKKLSSNKQNAKVLFYPGADADQMLKRLCSDPDFQALDHSSISKVFLLTGSNNIEGIYKGNKSLQSGKIAITNLTSFLHGHFTKATVNVLNILPRKIKGRNDVINELNLHIKLNCKNQPRIEYIDTETDYVFNDRLGQRKEMFFKWGSDNVHLNDIGIIRLGRHLKYLSHKN